MHIRVAFGQVGLCMLTKMGDLVPYHLKYLVECNYTACKCLLIEFKYLHGVWFAMHVQQFMEQFKCIGLLAPKYFFSEYYRPTPLGFYS